MPSLKNLALYASLFLSLNAGQAQAQQGGPAKTATQRPLPRLDTDEDIQAALWQAKPDADPIAKPMAKTDVKPSDTLYWADLDKETADYNLSQALTDAAVRKKSHLSFRSDDIDYVAPIETLTRIFRHNRKIYADHDQARDVGIVLLARDYDGNNDFLIGNDRSGSTEITGYALAHFGETMVTTMLEHERGHDRPKDSAARARLNVDDDLLVAEEFGSDEEITRRSGWESGVRIWLSVAGWLNDMAENSPDPERRKTFQKIREAEYCGAVDYFQSHPSLRRRVSHQVTLGRFIEQGGTLGVENPAMPKPPPAINYNGPSNGNKR